MKRYPLKAMKELDNEILRNQNLDLFKNKNIKSVNITQIHIIKYILDSKDGEVYQKDLCELLNIRKSTILGILSTMEKNKIITRDLNGVEKGKRIRLTPKAHECEKEVLKRLELLEEKLVDGITENELEVFFKVIDKMKENIKKKGFGKNDKDV